MSNHENWYYSVDGTEKVGPLLWAQIWEIRQADMLPPETLLWAPHLPGWVPAKELIKESMDWAEDAASIDNTPPPKVSPDVEFAHNNMGGIPAVPGTIPSARQDMPAVGETPLDSHQDTAEMIANMAIASFVLWGLLSLLQILVIPGTMVTIVGFFNAIMVATQFHHVSWIRRRRKDTIRVYDNILPLILAGVFNLFFGAYLGVLLIGFDFYIRHIVLKNRTIFVNA